MRRAIRTLPAVLLALALLAPPALAADPRPLAQEGGSGGDNVAVAINLKDGFELFKLAFKITRATGDVVDASNAAVAFASCEECQTVAIAIQVVLILSDPSVVTPENLAFAFNYECSMCETMAQAYQFVFTTGGPVHFTPEGYKTLAKIRRELQALRKGDLSLEEIRARVHELMAMLKDVLENEVVPAGPPEGKDQGDEEEGAETPEPTSSPTPSPSPSPSPSP